jgi:hypothetical protein
MVMKTEETTEEYIKNTGNAFFDNIKGRYEGKLPFILEISGWCDLAEKVGRGKFDSRECKENIFLAGSLDDGIENYSPLLKDMW